ANASFTAPTLTTPAMLKFQVKVTDGLGASSTDVVSVFVNVPVASYTVRSGDTWASIAQALYGTAVVASALQTALANPALTAGTVLTGYPDTLDGTVTFDLQTEASPPKLHSGTAIENIAVSPFRWHYYWIDVPEGSTQFTVTPTGVNGAAYIF